MRWLAPLLPVLMRPRVAAAAAPSTAVWQVVGGHSVTLSNGSLTATSIEGLVCGNVYGSGAAQTGGKFYCEFVINTIGSGYTPTMGIGTQDWLGSAASSSEVGLEAWSLRASGDIYGGSGPVTPRLSPLAVNDVVMMAVDVGAGKLWFGVNGTWDGNPAAGTGAAFGNLRSATTYPVSATNGAMPAATTGPDGSEGALTARFASTGWSYGAPSGFGQWA